MRAIYFEAKMPKIVATLALKTVWSGSVFGPTAPVRYSELPEPELPGPRGVRVRNRSCGICATDLHLLYVNVDPKVAPAAIHGADVIYLGHEVVSDVAEVGEEVTQVNVGDRVVMRSRFLSPNCHSQDLDDLCSHCDRGNYALCGNRALGKGEEGVGGGWGDGYTCHESELWKVPDGLDDDEAMLVEPLACSVRAVLRRLPQAGEKVAVIGCGTIGLGVVQALSALSPAAEIYAVARYPQQREAAARWGARLLDGDIFEATAEVTDGTVQVGEFSNISMLGGFDVIYDCVGVDTTIAQSLRLTEAGGSVVIVGVNLKPVRADLTSVWHQEVDLIGSVAHGMERWDGEDVSTYDLTARLLLEGKMTVEGMITHRFQLSDWKEAIRTSTDKSTGCIKVVFDY